MQDNCLIKANKLIKAFDGFVIPTDGSVTSIGSSCFYGLSIGELTLPAVITSVEYGAFKNCTNMSYVEIPGFTIASSINRIFENCSGDAFHFKATNARGDMITPIFEGCDFNSVEVSMGSIGWGEESGRLGSIGGTILTLNMQVTMFNSTPWSYALPSNLTAIYVPSSLSSYYQTQFAGTAFINILQVKGS